MPFGQRGSNRSEAEPLPPRSKRQGAAPPFKASYALYLVGATFLVLFGSYAVQVLQSMITVSAVEKKFEQAMEEKNRSQEQHVK